MPPSHRSLSWPRFLRLSHRYVGVFIAPALLFFAFTGALQTFSLHETTKGSDYKPPAWIVTLSQIHKKQTPVVAKKTPAKVKSPASDAAPPAAPAHNPLPLKLFFLLVALGLLGSTLSGIYMSYKHTRRPAAVTLLLVAGLVVPLALILF